MHKPPFATWDLLETERPLAQHYGQTPGGGWTGLEFSNNGRFVLVATNGPGHYLLDAFSGELVHYLHRPSGKTNHLAPGDTLNPSEPNRNTFIQADAVMSPDGQFVIGGNGGQTGLLVWDCRESGKKDKVLEPTSDLPSTKSTAVVAYNPRHNLVTSADKEVILWIPDPDAA